jgi:hypothetical protein
MFGCEETKHSEDVEPNILTNQRTIHGEIKAASVREAACGEPFVLSKNSHPEKSFLINQRQQPSTEVCRRFVYLEWRRRLEDCQKPD